METGRREFIKQLGALALCLTGSSQGVWAKASELAVTGETEAERQKKRNSHRLTIMHVNDVHSHIDPFPDDDPVYAGLGGYARRHKYIEKVRQEGNETLVFECGDMFQGTPYFNFYKGQLEISLMNKMGVDAVTIGNHEFDNGLEVLCKRMEEANFAFINSNYNFTSPAANRIVKRYEIFERCGIKIGVFGLGVKVKGLITDKNLEGTTYNDPINVAQKMANKLRNKGCQMVIALTHIGYDMGEEVDDKKLAAKTSGIDIILGGHSHTFLPEPVMIKNKDGKEVLVNQVGFAGINVGRIDIDIITENEEANKSKAISESAKTMIKISDTKSQLMA